MLINSIINKNKMINAKELLIVVYIFFCLAAVYPVENFIACLPILVKHIFRVSMMLSIIILYICDFIKTKKVDAFFLIVSIFFVYQFVLTFLKNEDISGAIYLNGIITFAGVMLFSYFTNKKVVKLFIISATVYFLLIFVLDIIYGFRDDSTNLERWFIGNRNHAFLYYFPLMFILYFVLSQRKNSYLVFFSIIIILHTLYLGSMASLIPLTMLSICIFIKKRFINENCLLIIYLIIVTVVFFVFVMPGTNSAAMHIIAPLLGKSETGSGRLEIYDKIISEIKNTNILFGRGLLTDEHYGMIMGVEYSGGKLRIYHSAHNFLLDFIFKYGIVGCIILTCELIVVIFSVDKQNNNVKRFMYASIFAILLRGMFESYKVSFFTHLISFVYFFSGKYLYNIKEKKLEYLITVE